MFESLTEKLELTFKRLRGQGKISETNIDDALREVRLALLEADVHVQVVKSFLESVKTKSMGQEVLLSLTPEQQFIKIVRDEMVGLLGGEHHELDLKSAPPVVIMLVGLQGAGKTTMAGKLALHLRKQGRRPLLIAADVYRPAAINQLETLGKQLDIPVYSEGTQANPISVAANGVKHAVSTGATTVIIDTAGRLNINEMMMDEIKNLKKRVQPIETLLVADAMTGQEAVRVATDFDQAVSLTGLIMTKIDGDARGGAAISMREVTGVPIKFLGTGEKLNAIEVFHPDRLANRILGMGDVMTLIEQAQAEMDMEEAQKAGERLIAGEFDLDDFLKQLQQVKKMGPIGKLLEMVPGMNKLTGDVDLSSAESDLKRVEAMIQSMTTAERHNPRMIKASRKRRIAVGSGTSVQEINTLLKQHREMQEMMKQFKKGGRSRGALASLLGGRM